VFLNSNNQKIIDYLTALNLNSERINYMHFLGENKKLSKTEIKTLLKNIHLDDFTSFKKNIIEILVKYKINPKQILKKSSIDRVKKHRDKNKKKGYKNISMQLPKDIHEKIKLLKQKKKMTYPELLSFLISDKK